MSRYTPHSPVTPDLCRPRVPVHIPHSPVTPDLCTPRVPVHIPHSPSLRTSVHPVSRYTSSQSGAAAAGLDSIPAAPVGTEPPPTTPWPYDPALNVDRFGRSLGGRRRLSLFILPPQRQPVPAPGYAAGRPGDSRRGERHAGSDTAGNLLALTRVHGVKRWWWFCYWAT